MRKISLILSLFFLAGCATSPERSFPESSGAGVSKAQAPRVLCLNGSLPLTTMDSFARFLVKMGYPKDSVLVSGSYRSSRELADWVRRSWEQDGMKPVLIGHSQGGMVVVKVLQELAGRGEKGPVVGFAAAIGTGRTMRFLLGQWDMLTRLRQIPDSVEEFTGFGIPNDLIGGDLWASKEANRYVATGTARVRNVTLPTGTGHLSVTRMEPLADNPAARAWIEAYRPSGEGPPVLPALEGDTENLLLAAELWYSIEKNRRESSAA